MGLKKGVYVQNNDIKNSPDNFRVFIPVKIHKNLSGQEVVTCVYDRIVEFKRAKRTLDKKGMPLNRGLGRISITMDDFRKVYSFLSETIEAVTLEKEEVFLYEGETKLP